MSVLLYIASQQAEEHIRQTLGDAGLGERTSPEDRRHRDASRQFDVLSRGVSATARASFYVYNDRDDVDALADALEATRDFFAL